MFSIALAFSSGLIWGTGDFLGGLAARRFGLAQVLVGTATGGMLLGVALALMSGDPFPEQRYVLMGAGAGVAGLVGLACFYHALAIGTMSIVAPISACGAAVPVAWGIAKGEQIDPLAAAAIVVLSAGVLLASRQQPASDAHEPNESHLLSVLLALAAAVSFGTVFALIAEAAEASIYWPSAVLKFSTLCVALLLVGLQRLRGAELGATPSGVQWLFPISIGFFDVTANVVYAAAVTNGTIAIASVVSSLYPVTTVLLAYGFLHERLSAGQRTGVLLAMVGVAILALT